MKKIVTVFTFLFLSLTIVSCNKSNHQITLNYNDDTNFQEVIEVKHKEIFNEPKMNLTKVGFEFKYWSLKGENKPFTFGKVTKDLNLEAIWESDGIRRGTFNRPYPTYYEKNVPLIDDAHVVYINFDGFARYYYDESLKQDPNSLPTLRSIMKEGVFFNDLRTTAPSITNPLQNMIISGATSIHTQNVYRYYDRDKNIVIQQQRENKAETIVTEALKNNLSLASVSFYLAEKDLTYNDPTKLHIVPDPTNPKVVARGPEKSSDYFSRFEQAIKLVKGEPINNNGTTVTVKELPKLIMIYADDLDAYGHNEARKYGVPVSESEEKRLEKCVNALREMDEKLGEFIDAAKEAGVYNKMTFILTTDHGMTPFGAISATEGGKYLYSKLGDLKYAINQFDKSYELEKVEVDEKPNSRTNVIGVGMNLNLQLTFKDGISDEKLEALKQHLLKEEYVGVVKTRKELEEEGYWTYAADMIISPSERYNFAPSVLGQYRVRGQHDSFLDTANHIYGIVWGNGIKNDYVYEERAYNYDFGITIASILGFDLPKANGIVLDIFDKKNK